MSQQQHPDDDASTDEQTAEKRDEPAKTADRPIDVRLDADRLATAVDAATAIVDECRMTFDGGLAFRARDPADVAMAELRLDREAFDAYAANDETVGVALDRLGDAVSLADDGAVRLAMTADGRFDVTTDGVEYTFAPIAAEAVRQVEWVDPGATAASATMAAADLRRAVRAADLVADHATFVVDPDADLLTVAAEGDTDDVRLDFDADDLDAFEPGAVESLYSVDYLGDIVGAVPRDVPVTVEFLGGDEGGCPLSLEHPIAEGTGTGRWLLAPRIRR